MAKPFSHRRHSEPERSVLSRSQGDPKNSSTVYQSMSQNAQRVRGWLGGLRRRVPTEIPDWWSWGDQTCFSKLTPSFDDDHANTHVYRASRTIKSEGITTEDVESENCASRADDDEVERMSCGDGAESDEEFTIIDHEGNEFESLDVHIKERQPPRRCGRSMRRKQKEMTEVEFLHELRTLEARSFATKRRYLSLTGGQILPYCLPFQNIPVHEVSASVPALPAAEATAETLREQTFLGSLEPTTRGEAELTENKSKGDSGKDVYEDIPLDDENSGDIVEDFEEIHV